MNWRKNFRFLMIICVLGFIALSCSLPVPGENEQNATLLETQNALLETQNALQIQQQELAQQESAQQPAPEQAAPSEVPPPVVEQPALQMVDFEGVRFSFDPSLASSVTSEFTPVDTGEMLPMPQHLSFVFNNYVVSDHFHTPQIKVINVPEYAAVNEYINNEVNELTRILTEKPADPENLPFLPLWNAAQVFVARVHYLDFQNGSGVAYLTKYAQDVSPVSNHDIFYTFQGLTREGTFIHVSAVMPVNHPALPTDYNLSGEEYEAFAENYLARIAETRALLEAQPADSFTPNLDLLDQAMQSILAQ